MGLRIRRSVQLFPGVRLNLGKTGVGISAGVRGLRVGIDSRGRKYGSAGLPGTGLSIREYEHEHRELPPPGRHIEIQPLGWLVIIALVAFLLWLIGNAL